MRASSTFFTVFVAAALIAPSVAVPIEKRDKVCPAQDNSGTALISASTTADGFLDCEYGAAGNCEYFLNNGNFSSGSSVCPKAGLDAGAPGASSGGATSAAPAPPAATTPAPPAATTPAPAPPAATSPAPAPPAATTPAPAPGTPIGSGVAQPGSTTGTSAGAKPTGKNAAMGRFVPNGTGAALVAGIAVALSAWVM